MDAYNKFSDIADSLGYQTLAEELYNYMNEDDRNAALDAIIREYDLDVN